MEELYYGLGLNWWEIHEIIEGKMDEERFGLA